VQFVLSYHIKRDIFSSDNIIMGCEGSRFDMVPVTGHPSGLAVVPSTQYTYLKPEPTILKLREKFWSWSGDDASVKDINGTKWFQIHGSAMSFKEKRVMEDISGNEVCGYQKKLLSMHATAYIWFKDANGEKMVMATIKRKSNFSFESSADIYLHQPPVHIDNVSTSGIYPSIHVEGDIISRKYDFMMGDIQTNPFKIAQVVRKWRTWSDNDSYFIEIGPNVDVAFICMSAYAIDELFSDNN